MTNSNQSTQNTIELDPKCLKGFEIAYSATGFILPCCYADNKNISDFSMLMEDKLKLDNNNDVYDIIESKQWLEFFNMLINTPDEAPRACKYYCNHNWSTKDYEYNGT